MTGLWVGAPATWIVRYFLSETSRLELKSLEFVALLLGSALMLISTVGLRLRPQAGRALGLLGLVIISVAISAQGLAVPHVSFLALSTAALVGYGLLTQNLDFSTPKDHTLAAHLWSRAILSSSIIALLLGGLTLTNQIASPQITRSMVNVLWFCAASVAFAAERDIVIAGLWPKFALAGLGILTLGGAILSFFSDIGLVLLAIRLGFSILWAAQEQRRRADLLGMARLHPARFAVGSFGLASLVGAYLLALPFASASEKSIALVDAFFTATSAVCVTGLVTISTGKDLSMFGQAVVLTLIQIGGLGIMTLSAMIVLAAGKQLAGGTEHALGESMGGGSSPQRVFQTIRAIAISTILIEAVGALSIFGLTQDQFSSTTDAMWFAVFHAVSAFCNAGFALQNESLTRFSDQPLVLHTISTLIILGGMGFGVMLGAVQTVRRVIKAQFFRRRESKGLFSIPQFNQRIDINVQLVSIVTACFLIAGFVGFAALEWHASLSQLGFGAKLHNAWFQSVTLRTAGFNTVDLNVMNPGMIVLALLFMFIGASPGSTGGGIKTSTIAVLFFSMTTVFSKKKDTEVLGRRIDPEVVSRAVAVTCFSGLTVFIGSFLLILTQNAPFEVLLFEATSAVATAGLSIGGTAALDDSGKFIVMILMLIGRIGPITTAALWQTNKQERHRFPKAEVIVG